MGCYKCGSGFGSANVLCPSCENGPVAGSTASTAGNQSFKDFLKPEILAVAITGIVILTGGYFVLFSSHGPQLGVSLSTQIYTTCMKKTAAADNPVLESLYANLPTLEGQVVNAKGNDAVCTILKEACANEPLGATCKQARALLR